MIDKNKIPDDDMECINGGNAAELDQITRFIQRNDSRHYSDTMYVNRVEVIIWMKNNIPDFESCRFYSDGRNEYYLKGSAVPLSQKDLMDLLEKNVSPIRKV